MTSFRKNKFIFQFLTGLIAFVWLAYGLFCKVLNLVPRHGEIVGRILGNDYARTLTILIGISEILMMVWMLSGIKKRWNAIAQMLIVGVMNVIEFLLVPDLLLWGRLNSVFAALFIGLVYYREFVLRKQLKIS